MAVEFLKESPSLTTSPRASFSSDPFPDQTQNTDQTPDLQDFSFHAQPTDTDFHFTFSAAAAVTHLSPADELFNDGLIRPLQPISLFPPTTTTDHPSIPQKTEHPETELPETGHPETGHPMKPATKSIWGIRRSSSVHCEGSSHKKGSSFWSLPLLARSNSTGSKETQKQRQKETRNCSSSSSSNSSFSMYNFSQKPPLKKNHGNGIRMINPVLNVPGTFGFNSLFRNSGKERKNKK